jgi:hypothetical protein
VHAQDAVRLEHALAQVEIAPGSMDATVVVRYALALAQPADTIRVRAIPFFGLRPAAVTATVDGGGAMVDLAGGDGARLAGTIVPRAGAPVGRAIELVLRYTVVGAVAAEDRRLDVRVPLLLVDAAPASSDDGFFSAELHVPSGIAVVESFPTVPLRQDTAPAGTRYALVLPAVPSLLRWRATDGPAPLLSFVAGVDLFLLALILVLAGFGTRALLRRA